MMRRRQSSAAILAVLCLIGGAVLAGRAHFSVSGSAEAAARPAMPVQEGDLPANQWRTAKASERKLAVASILAQLKAFQKNDFVTAAIYQSSDLRLQMQSTDAFKRMMTMRYPEFLSYTAVRFGPARATPDGSNVQVPVVLTGKDGTITSAVYLMVLESKVYRVQGVMGGATPVPSVPSTDASLS